VSSTRSASWMPSASRSVDDCLRSMGSRILPELKYMLVLANAASIGRLTGFAPPRYECRNPKWLNSSIDPEKLADALARLDYHIDDYMAKTHFGEAGATGPDPLLQRR